MAQNARSHRKLKIAGIVALVVVVALLGFAGNFLFDFALNPRAPYTMKMMQDSKNDKEGEQPDAEGTEARAWFKENRKSSNLTADDGPSLPPGILLRRRARTTTPSACMDIPTSPSVWPDTPNASTTVA
ncbi:MAG: hypothetical protein ACLU0O_02195 [Collinsella sp.]